MSSFFTEGANMLRGAWEQRSKHASWSGKEIKRERLRERAIDQERE
jgi:hypothetical protein